MTNQIAYVVGDATDPIGKGHKIICHICNDVGAWGAGFVLALSAKWAEPERRYREWVSAKVPPFELGAAQFVQVEENIFVCNMVAQSGVGHKDGPPIRYDAVETCLHTVYAFQIFQLRTEVSIHMPRIGCGLAGGSWDMIEPIINRTLVDKGVGVTVYDFPARS